MTTQVRAANQRQTRNYPIGVELLENGGAHVRVWAPKRRTVEMLLYGSRGEIAAAVPLERGESGYFSGMVADAAPGSLYRFRLDGGDAFPDPVSRFQPEGPHGPSQIIDPRAFRWTDDAWRGVRLQGQVLYELHVGTFTPEGTYAAAADRLADLVDVGVSCIEVMPLADFPGRFGWGYDGVSLFAPTRLYGAPDDLRALVDRAHALGLGVLLDVVYNHLGPDGNYLRQYSDRYFSSRTTEWGEAINFDETECAPVREFFLTNATYWVEEYHFDGLRLDATQQIFDASRPHIVEELTARVRDAARGRGTLVIGENEPQQASFVRPREEGGCGLDALWNDDFHHSAAVALTGRDEAYYSGYRGNAQELVSSAKYGFLFQGQYFAWQKKRRGTPAFDIEPARFVNFLENHDQVANSGRGERMSTVANRGRTRAMTALLMLLPQTPLLFQGQEFGSTRPFFYFADHNEELSALVADGRAEFLSQFPSLATPEGQARLADPADPSTFTACKLDWGERERHRGVVALHRDLARLRREDPVLSAQRPRGLDGVALTSFSLALRWFDDTHGDRLLVVNLGRRVRYDPAPEPLLAPPLGARWRVAFSTEDPRYGGWGTPSPDNDDAGWTLLPESAVLLIPEPHVTTDR
jgi:maltooligosyltrehalose trehalohydrolase